MSGITFSCKAETDDIIASVDPLLFEGDLSEAGITELMASTEFKGCSLNAQAIADLSTQVKTAKAAGNMDVIDVAVGTMPSSGVSIEIAEDKMSATVTLTADESKACPSFDEIKALLARKNVKRGISRKRILNLINSVLESDPGKEFSDIVAKGLPARDGKASRVIPLVPNALDRILRPQSSGEEKVDMRNLGDVLCVSANQPVARRASPSSGRIGYTVTDLKLTPEKGEWKDLKLGANTCFAQHDENLILSELAGQPKFDNGVMSIDDTYVSKGVNVGTGNVKYEGAVIVNGDVTENMQIIAKGDVTINGFVESAFIQSGGDIIITQGATGKMNDEDCRLVAAGSIFIQHGQGMDIQVEKDLNVKRQLAYSRITCKGNIYVGDPDNPTGNLFASTINAYGTIKAGSVGAVSGSALEIDYSDGLNQLNERLESINDMLSELVSKNADHEVRLSKINAKKIPNYLTKKLKSLDSTLAKERALLNWLRKVQGDLEQAKKDYEVNARIIANKEMFPGVSVKLNKRVFRAKKETLKSRVVLVEGNWEYQPIIQM